MPSPSTPSASAATSPKIKSDVVQAQAPNPFFGSRPIKKSPPVNMKDDFNPFKHANNKVPEPTTVGTCRFCVPRTVI